MRHPVALSHRRLSLGEMIFGAIVALMVLKLVAQQSFGGTHPATFDNDSQMNDEDGDGTGHEDYAETEEAPRASSSR